MKTRHLFLALAAVMLLGTTMPALAQKKMKKMKPATTATVNDDKPGRGELGLFDLRGPVQKCVTKFSSGMTQTLTFNKKGFWLTEDGRTLKKIYQGDDRKNSIIRDRAGRIIRGTREYAYDNIEYNANGLVKSWSFESGVCVEEYEYDADGHVAKQTTTLEGEMGSDEPNEVTVRTFTIIATDQHGNWTQRKDNTGAIDKRTITYY